MLLGYFQDSKCRLARLSSSPEGVEGPNGLLRVLCVAGTLCCWTGCRSRTRRSSSCPSTRRRRCSSACSGAGVARPCRSPSHLARETALSRRRSTPLPRAQVTFQFTKHETVDGQIWLIDQERASQPTSSLPHPPAPSPSPSLPPSPPPPGARQGRLRRTTERRGPGAYECVCPRKPPARSLAGTLGCALETTCAAPTMCMPMVPRWTFLLPT